MVQNLRLILVIIGAIVVIALLVHGFWLSKREKSSVFVNREPMNKKYKLGNQINEGGNTPIEEADSLPVSVAAHEVEPPHIVVNPQEPVQGDFFVSFNEHDDPGKIERAVEKTADNEQKPQQVSDEKPQEQVFILHVKGFNDKPIKGEELYHTLQKLGLHYGAMNIFHRHLDSVGNGPVLFSLANMIKPGNFVLDEMMKFTTPGISLFMVVPCYGDAQQNFKLMLQTAQRVADGVGGIVLDDERYILTPQKIDVYKQKIKELVAEPQKV